MSNVVWVCWCQLGTVGWTGADDFEHGREVGEGKGLWGAWVDGDVLLVVRASSMEDAIHGGQQGFATGDGKAGVLAFAQE